MWGWIMSVIDEIFSDGERRPLIVSDDGTIDFWSTLYVTAELRSDGKQTTIKKELYSIKLIRTWEHSTGRDLLEEFRRQKLLDRDTIRSIKDFCLLSAKKGSRKSKKVVNFTRLAKIESPLNTVDKTYQYQRMLGINHYLEFCAWEICKFKPNASELRDKIDKMVILFKSHYPKGLSNISKVTHAEASAFEHFMQVIRIGHEDNPFKNFDTQLRNYLQIAILYWTGCRPSEVLALTLDDIIHDIDEPKLCFIRRHDDINDPRPLQPTLKTQERDIEIPPTLYSDLEYYIRKVRSNYKLSKTHPYIFISQKGESSGIAMSDKNFSSGVMAPLKEVSKSFENIQRRGFRIYFNERFSDQVDKHNAKISKQIQEAEARGGETENIKRLEEQIIRDGKEIDTRMRIMGHSSPTSSRTYLDRRVTRIAKKIHKQMMLDTSATVREIKNARDKK
jgi:integrase